MDHFHPDLKPNPQPEQAKAHLSEARELVGPDGPSPSPAEEQDIVLELGTLWYIRHALCSSKVDVCHFLALLPHILVWSPWYKSDFAVVGVVMIP